ncbi:MAG TPA: transposase [Candidatus Acidoferrum sp.]|nr:transposase [Candidatus Acidoferrum sp.]
MPRRRTRPTLCRCDCAPLPSHHGRRRRPRRDRRDVRSRSCEEGSGGVGGLALFLGRLCPPCATSVPSLTLRRHLATKSHGQRWPEWSPLSATARRGCRAFKAIEEKEGATWLRRHLAFCAEPLLAEPWILDVDTTVKPLYGHQEGAVLGYNPKKPGRPSHCYHTYSMASTRLVLDVDVCPGDEHASKHGAPSLWALLDRLPRDLWPTLLRGDCGFGNEGIMREAEARGLAFLFKLRLTANVKRMIEKLAGAREWVCAGDGFEAKESAVRLTGWSRSRRVIVLRRRVKGALGLSQIDEAGAPQLSFAEIGATTEVYEYSVLVTSLDEDTEAFGQLYRDRGDGENIFDEMKNQWGWGGFTTHDLARCRLAARLLALFYDWWTIFVRLVDPSLHREAITSRPLFLSAIATRTRHARQTTIRVTSSHAKAKPAARALAAAAVFLRGLAKSAEQLTRLQKWRAILSRAFQAFLNGRALRAPPRLAPI